MAGRIVHVRPGRDAEDSLVRVMKDAQCVDPLAPVTVVVRSGVVALDLRRRLAARGPFAATRFTPFNRLVELLAAPGLERSELSRRPLTEAVLRAAVRRALRAVGGPLDEVADHPATEMMLARTYRTLRPLSEQELRALGTRSRRARQVVAVFEGARSFLEKDFYDIEELTALAAERLERGEVDEADLGALAVYLPDPLSRSQLTLLAVAARNGPVTVLLSRTGDPVADRASTKLASCLREEGFDEGGAELASPPLVAEPPRFDSVIGAPDAEEEVRTALRLLIEHLEEGGELGRTAVAIAGSLSSSYLGVIEELFGTSNVPFARARTPRLSETPAGALVSGLVALVLAGEGELERSEVIRWLSSPALSPHAPIVAGLPSVREAGIVPVGAFDRSSRAAGVVSGRDEWRSRLRAYAHSRSDRPASGDPFQAAVDLGEIVERLLELRDRLSRALSWGEAAAVVGEAAESVLPASEERDRVLDAVAQLSFLEEVEPLATLGDLAARRSRMTSSVLTALEVAAPAASRFGSGPVVGSLTQLAGVRADYLVLLGANEGVLPSRTAEDPLLPEPERAIVPTLSERERSEERDRRALVVLLAGAERSVALFPRVARGASRLAYASRWLAGDLFLGSPAEIPSFSAAAGEVAAGRVPAADWSDLELAIVHDGISMSLPLEDLVVGHVDDMAARVRAESERSLAVTRFGGAVGESALTSGVFDAVMSATRLETLAACPLQFMFTKLLELEPLDSPERRHTIDARERGSLIHGILESFVIRVSIEGETPVWSEADLDILREIAGSAFSRFEEQGKGGKPLYWAMEKRRMLAELEQFVLREADGLRNRSARPVGTEFRFGMTEASEPIVIKTGGRELRFRGAIDRVDRAKDGTIIVVDYKTGRPSSALPKDPSDPLGRGQCLQLPVYARAARERIEPEVDEDERDPMVVAEYHFTAPNASPRCYRVALTPDVDANFETVVGVLADTVAGGKLPPRPGNGDEQQPENCKRCDLESVCRLDRLSLWERARQDDSLSPYVELVEGARA